MNIEIERKFLVNSDGWKSAAGKGIACRQGYINCEGEATVRVRLMDDHALLTIKGDTQGISRPEYEYEIPMQDGIELLALCPYVVEKIRYKLRAAGALWELDVFSGENAGLVMAEIELESEDQPFERPEWVGQEVSEDPRYRNAHLARHPFSTW